MLLSPDVRSSRLDLLAGLLAPMAFALALGCGDSASGPSASKITYRPWEVIHLSRPGSSERVDFADPAVIRVDGTWYLYGTSSPEGFETWSSADLATWEYRGFAWRPTPGSWNDRGNYWAPHVHVRNDGYWLYYTADQRIGVARADSPLGPFVEVLDHPLVGSGWGGVGDGVLVGSNGPFDDLDEESIDPFLFERKDGSLFLYVQIATPIPVVAVLPMADPATPSAPAPIVVLEPDLASWEWIVREAPWIVEHDGILHLMYSGYVYTSTCYAVGDATSLDPLGPFVRRPDNPILHDDPAVGFFGPGHHAVVEGAHGDLLIFFHTRTDGDVGVLRDLRYGVMRFDDRGAIVFDPPPPGDSAPGFNSCFPRT